jgi:uncharacterized protein
VRDPACKITSYQEETLVLAKVAPSPPPAPPAPAPVAPAPARSPIQLSANYPPGPSFSCTPRSRPDELAICRSVRLGQLDRELDAQYRATRGRLVPSEQLRLRDQQRDWLRRRAACGGSEPCLISQYEERIPELKAW